MPMQVITSSGTPKTGATRPAMVKVFDENSDPSTPTMILRGLFGEFMGQALLRFSVHARA
ncbi:hypothetical protein NicSoilE8_18800 [Arthrobacter sp. NicSoilE8]|nr:hypothetical protein NicSoilE8_18800 [Arthrobacter sp. NicSoilE8]GLU64440.1 hypothetical protein Pure02_26900 [Paenarthrobacter ureafaciens]GLU68690.1 hypothetical protein Pure03_26660 [Paenarthrobacter ureafaciens]GLU72975.1 hypothetical protein Pure04_26900 [Paenarthrobacter ureafaciens]